MKDDFKSCPKCTFENTNVRCLRCCASFKRTSHRLMVEPEKAAAVKGKKTQKVLSTMKKEEAADFRPGLPGITLTNCMRHSSGGDRRATAIRYQTDMKETIVCRQSKSLTPKRCDISRRWRAGWRWTTSTILSPRRSRQQGY